MKPFANTSELSAFQEHLFLQVVWVEFNFDVMKAKRAWKDLWLCRFVRIPTASYTKWAESMLMLPCGVGFFKQQDISDSKTSSQGSLGLPVMIQTSTV